MTMKKSLKDRILGSVVVNDNGCWIWQKYVSRDGYGKMTYNGHPSEVYRLSYELFVGDIPDGHHLHHICGSKACCNYDHVIPIMPGAHSAKHFGDKFKAHTEYVRSKTHCKQGHPLSGSNLYLCPRTGYRACRTCVRLWARNYRSRKGRAA
jgi:hypothetical protein